MLSRYTRVVENAFGIISQKFQIYQGTLHSLPENADIMIFATWISHSYLRNQGVGLSDMGVLQMIKSISQKYQNQQVVTTEVLFK